MNSVPAYKLKLMGFFYFLKNLYMIYLLYLYKSKKSLSRNSQVNRQPLPNPMEKGLKPFKYFYFTTKKTLYHLRLLFFTEQLDLTVWTPSPFIFPPTLEKIIPRSTTLA